MNRRTALRSWVKIGLLACIAGFAGVFALGLLAPGRFSSTDVIDIGGLPAGAGRLEAWNGRPIWVVHRSASQLQGLSELAGHVLEPGAGGSPRIASPHRSLERDYGVYLAATDRSGILVQYVRERPGSLGSDVPWHGGFVDPGSEAVFDIAGRRYRSTPGGPLAVPPHRFGASGVIRLGEW